MGNLDSEKLDLIIEIKDERTSDKYVNFISMSLVIILNLIAAFVLWTSK